MIKYYHFSRAVVTLDVDRNVSTVLYSTSFAGVNWIFTLSWEDKIFPTTMKGSYVGPFFIDLALIFRATYVVTSRI